MLYEKLLRPLLFRLPPESAHEWSMRLFSLATQNETARSMLERRFAANATRDFGTIERFNVRFKNPIGLAAGFDKNGEHTHALAALGFGFVEVGTVTPQPQVGNPQPRLFRLPEDKALINRQGFNNDGASKLIANLNSGLRANVVIGINIGKNRTTPNEEAARDYVTAFDVVREAADYITVNVSSPNTPNLRALQRADALDEILRAIQTRNHDLALSDETGDKKNLLPVLVKVAPDLGDEDLEVIVDVARRNRLAGIIATNTTIARENLRTPRAKIELYGAGGLSGAPLRERSTNIIEKLYKLSHGSLVIIGVGGIFSGQDAFEKIIAGASLVQLYTGFVYRGYDTVQRINHELAAMLRGRGLKTLDEAVGSKHL